MKNAKWKMTNDPVASTTPSGLPAWGPRSARGSDTAAFDLVGGNPVCAMNAINIRPRRGCAFRRTPDQVETQYRKFVSEVR